MTKQTNQNHHRQADHQDISAAAPLSPYGYTNYRQYLRDYYERRKESTRGYSYRSFAKAAGFTAPNFLKLVIDGVRNIGQTALPKFTVALCLKGHMAEYFETLVKMNQAKSDHDKEVYFVALQKLIPAKKKRLLQAESHKYLSHWLYPVLREMVSLPEFREDPYWIARRLNDRATVQEISAALAFLQKEGFIAKDAKGRLHSTDNMVLSEDEVRNLAIRAYHRQMLEQAQKFLEILPLEEREFGALTLLLPADAIDELKERMKNFRRELHAWALEKASEKQANIVVQVNSHMYPHTKKLTRAVP